MVDKLIIGGDWIGVFLLNDVCGLSYFYFKWWFDLVWFGWEEIYIEIIVIWEYFFMLVSGGGFFYGSFVVVFDCLFYFILIWLYLYVVCYVSFI